LPRKTLWIGIAVITLMVAFSATILFNARSRPVFHGQAITPPVRAAEIRLADQNGIPFQLSDKRGKVVLVAFGFTNCVDECPLTMAHIKLAIDMLGSSSQNVMVVMVSTDPVRDTPQAMKDFLGKFSTTFIGLPGTSDELATIWHDYGVEVLDGGETHSSFTYMIDRKGNLRLTFTPETLPEDIASDLKLLLAE
jgi:protein SCO1/2